MKPETAAAIARRIGMHAEPVDGGVFVRETDALYGHTMTADGLATYLATGDRPLRVMEAYRMAVDTHPSDKEAVWWAGGDTAQAYGATPAAAILACAAALEEGHE